MAKYPTKALIIYKRSPLLAAGTSQAAADPRFRQNHTCHYSALRKVEAVLRTLKIPFSQQLRGVPFNRHDSGLIITVGGDGTFLDAARKASEDHLILGVNSDTSWSVGQFCAADAGSFKRILEQSLSSPRFKKVFKLRATFSHESPRFTIECLNDLLVCHANPAAMSRYDLAIGSRSERQRSSGVWFSSAAGSTGAILSAGGKRLPLTSKTIQYKPREIYQGKGAALRLRGGLVKAGESINISSLMPHGRVFVDGAHIKHALPFGKTLKIQASPHFIRMIHD